MRQQCQAGPRPQAGDAAGSAPELIGAGSRVGRAENQVVPVASEGETVVFVAVDHQNIALADKLSFLIARKVRLVSATREEIVALLKRYYPNRGKESESVDSMLQEFTDTAIDFDEEPVHASVAGQCSASPISKKGTGRSTLPTAASASSRRT